MSVLRKVLVAFIAIGAVSIIFLTWYSVQHAKDEAIDRPLALGPAPKILVAADQVDVRDSLIRKVIHGLEAENITIEVYNLSDLTAIDEREWSAIVVFQKTDKAGKPGKKVSQIKSFTRGFLVSVNNSHNYTLEGGNMKSVAQLNGLDSSAFHIVNRLYRAAHGEM